MLISNRITVKNLISFLLVLLVLSSITTIAEAAVPIPSGFQIISQGAGVRVFRKTYSSGAPDYATVVDLRSASISSFTGWVYGDPNGVIERRTLTTHWNNAVAQNTFSRSAKVAINGTFFVTEDTPNTGIAFGLKAGWWRMSYGYGLGEFPGLIRTLAFDSSFGSSSIQPYDRGTFDSGIPDVVGGLDPAADKNKSSFIGRTFVGVRDDNGDGHSETVVFFSSASASQQWAVDILNGFGTGSKMMLDGGGSAGLIIDGEQNIMPSGDRTLPHVFIIWAGK